MTDTTTYTIPEVHQPPINVTVNNPTATVTANAKPSRPDLATLLAAEVTRWTASRDADLTNASRLRTDITARDRKIAKALADIDTWRHENSEDTITAKLADSGADSARKQLAELDRATKKLEAK